ncbi:MAG: hypothetical protein ACOYBP_08880 [Microbacteriaceae bacterium]
MRFNVPRKRKKKLAAPLEAIEAFVTELREILDEDKTKPDDEKLSVTARDKLQARLLQAERIRSNAIQSDKKMSISLLASPEWRDLSAKLTKEQAKCTCGVRERVLELLGDRHETL